MYQIEELPDLKVAWHESYKCLNEPLLEYVWEVANHFLPDYAETDTGMIPVGKSSVSCPLKPSDSAPLKHSTMPP